MITRFPAIIVFSLIGAQMATADEKIARPLGFRTIDFSSSFWSSLDPTRKMRGRVSDSLTYKGIEKIIIIRCDLHVPAGDYLERTIRSSIPPGNSFELGPVTEAVLKKYLRPRIILLFQTHKADFGLLTVYPGMTIVELNGRCGLILTNERETGY